MHGHVAVLYRLGLSLCSIVLSHALKVVCNWGSVCLMSLGGKLPQLQITGKMAFLSVTNPSFGNNGVWCTVLPKLRFSANNFKLKLQNN